MKITRRVFVLASSLAVVVAAGCATSPAVVSTPADTIYYGGTIITVDDAQPTAEAVAVLDGKIAAVGSQSVIARQFKGSATRMVDLAGNTLVPGFVDAHSHFSMVGLQAKAANLLPPPDGPATSIAQIQQIMRDYIATSPTIEEYAMALGFNYDDSQLVEKRHPTAAELDAISTEMPVVVMHQSGHLGVYNSRALELAGVSATTPNPPGGKIYRKADGKTPTGLMDENAHISTLMKLLPKFTPEQVMGLLTASQEIYIANGFTTVQDGRTDPATLQALPFAGAKGLLKVDLVSYPDLEMAEKSPMLVGPAMSRDYTNHFRIGGVKLTFDGSPQGKTAWFTQPYFQSPEGQPADYAGEPIFSSDEEPVRLAKMAYANSWQLLVHANGDAAIDQLIRVAGAAEAAFPGEDRRTVLIHGQYLRADQISALSQLGIFPALYPMHTFYWGDWHRTSVAGPERAEFISPTGAVLGAGMKFSIHSDAPVTFPNSMRLLDSAVNRTTRTGYVLGPQQRIEPLVALKAMTLWPAYQHFEEDTKGSIEVGKVADFVVLSENPLGVERARLIDINVVETIKAGESIYRIAQ